MIHDYEGRKKSEKNVSKSQEDYIEYKYSSKELVYTTGHLIEITELLPTSEAKEALQIYALSPLMF